MKSIPLCIHYCKTNVKKNGIEHAQVDLNKNCFYAYIIRPNTCFNQNLGGLVLFLVFLYKMRYVTDYAQIGPILWE